MYRWQTLSDNRKLQNPSQYGTWHEINLEDIEDESLPYGHVLKPLRKRHDEAEAISPDDEPAVTFIEDENLAGLDAVIRNLKRKAVTTAVPEPDNTPERSEQLDEIGKSVLQGMTTDDFLDALERELEENVHNGDNVNEDQPDET